jgi:hypothetical protein
MHPIGKIIIGAMLIIGSVYYVWNNTFGAWSDLKTVLNGMVPPFVFLIGLFIVWLELDELKIERELKAEERKAKRKKG